MGVFTKTSETYIIAAIGVSLVSHYVLETNELTLVGLSLAGLSFFRSLGNPLSQDTEMAYFRMIPESTFKKLFWSLAAGTVNCLLDVCMAMIPAAILLGANPLVALAWILFIASVDFYATNVGTFIDLSVPVSAGKMVKQFVQIMFVYFGLIPDALILLLCSNNEAFGFGCVLTALINVLIGLIFLSISPLFLEPREQPWYAPVVLSEEALHTAKHHFSLAGMGLFVILVASSVIQIILGVYLNASQSSLLSQEWVFWVINFAPLYLIGVPLGLLILKKIPAHPLEKQKLEGKRWLTCL